MLVPISPSVPPGLPSDVRAELHRVLLDLRALDASRRGAARVARTDWHGVARQHFDRSRATLDARLASLTDQLALIAGR